MEKAIAEVWKEVLGLKTLSRNDDFFEKGGDSLKAMAVVNELNNKQLSSSFCFSSIMMQAICRMK